MVVGESSGGREEILQTKDDREQRVREKRMSDFFRAHLLFVFVFIYLQDCHLVFNMFHVLKNLQKKQRKQKKIYLVWEIVSYFHYVLLIVNCKIIINICTGYSENENNLFSNRMWGIIALFSTNKSVCHIFSQTKVLYNVRQSIERYNNNSSP